MIAHRKKMMPIIFRIRRRLRKRVLQYGGPLEERLRRRDVRGSNSALMAGCLRPVLRERAKHTLLAFLQGGADRAFLAAKFQKFLQRVIMLQRVATLRARIKQAAPLEW